MSLFKCVECGCVENTALAGLAWEHKETGEAIEGSPGPALIGLVRRRLICSQCNPAIGKWHGVFPRVDADEADYVPIPGSRYIEKAPTSG